MIIEFLPLVLKGIHNAIDGWQEERDEDGIRDDSFYYQEMLEAHYFTGRISIEEYKQLTEENLISKNPPKEVVAIPKLF